MPNSKHQLTRDEKVENLIVNHTMITMGMLEGAFSALTSGMADAMSKTAYSLAQALNGIDSSSSASKANTRGPEPDPGSEVAEKTARLFSEMRKEVASKLPTKDPSFKAFISDPSFDQGVRIVESYDFGLPRLTERLSDADLAGYLTLLHTEDNEFETMWRELAEWQGGTPRFERGRRRR